MEADTVVAPSWPVAGFPRGCCAAGPWVPWVPVSWPRPAQCLGDSPETQAKNPNDLRFFFGMSITKNKAILWCLAVSRFSEGILGNGGNIWKYTVHKNGGDQQKAPDSVRRVVIGLDMLRLCARLVAARHSSEHTTVLLSRKLLVPFKKQGLDQWQ